MTDWRYCGQFSYMSQEPVPGHGWIDVAEARARFTDRSAFLTIVAPVDETTGIAPSYIGVGTGTTPSFHVCRQTPPGVPEVETWWLPTDDDRLFGEIGVVWEYPPVAEILFRNTSWALSRIESRNRRDGTGTLTISTKGEQGATTAERRDIPVDRLIIPQPEWGDWNALI